MLCKPIILLLPFMYSNVHEEKTDLIFQITALTNPVQRENNKNTHDLLKKE